MKIYLTRFSGKISFLGEEQNSSGAFLLEESLIKRLVNLGYTIVCHKDQCTSKLVSTIETIKSTNTDSWLNNIELLDGFIYPDIPDDINYVFIQQGHENLRFKSVHSIPGQLILYRQLRNCKCPIIYIQYDSALPLFLPPIERGKECSVLGFTLEEMINLKILLVTAGKDSSNIAYSHNNTKIFKNIANTVMENDLHSVGVNVVKDYYLPYNDNVTNSVRFIGKDRRVGSRRDSLIELAKNLKSVNYELILNGKWDKEHFVDTDVNYQGTLPNGIENVVKAYNSSKFAVLIGNDIYKSSKQYTLRVFEVLASSTVPLFEYSWFCTWDNIFTPDVRDFIYKYLTFDTIDEIPTIINNLKDKCLKDIAKFVRQGLLDKLTDESIDNNLKKLLQEADNIQKESQDKIDEFYNKRLEDFKGSKLSRIREAALERVNDIKKYNTISDELIRLSTSDELYNTYLFENSDIPLQELKRLFGR